MERWEMVGREATILKNRKILLSLWPIDRFWQNSACWCVSTLVNRIANKISNFKNSRWRRWSSWKYEKLQHLRNGITNFTKFGEVMCLGHLATASEWNLWIWQSKMAAAAILKNRKIIISSQLIDRFGRNLACWCVLTLSAPTANKISLFQDGGNSHFDKRLCYGRGTARRACQ